MADETTIVQVVDEQKKSSFLPQSEELSNYAEVIPDDSWFERDILKRLKSALNSGFMVDLNVILQDGNVRCHSNILGISSPKLAAMIRKNQHEINLPGVKSDTFKMLLRVVYSEDVEELKTDVKTVLEVAKVSYDLKVFAAVIYCIKLLREQMNATNVCYILDFASLLDHDELKEACTKIIQKHTDEVLKSRGFLKCNVSTLEHILKQTVVHNVTELELFQAAVHWTKGHEYPRDALGSSLSLIRFRTFTTEDIAECVTPVKILSKDEEQQLLWLLLAKGKSEMPAGFNNQEEKRHTTWSAEHIRASTEEIYLGRSDWKYVTKEELLATPPLRISVNEDAFLIGVQPFSYREGKIVGDRYMEDVEVTLKDDKGTLIATPTFKGEVRCGSNYDVKFPHAVELYADVTYELHFSHNVSGVKYFTAKRVKQVYDSKTKLEISLLDDQYSSINKLIIAPKKVLEQNPMST